jgi:hypothetical protein
MQSVFKRYSKFQFMRILSLTAILVALTFSSCSHDYHSNTLDLTFYQWNMWPEENAGPGSENAENPPSIGWEEMHRGVGKLVRIPAGPAEHFSPEEESDVIWFHTRHTLPELWAQRKISLRIEGLSHMAEVYLNEKRVVRFVASDSALVIDVTGVVYYTRDNHLCIRTYDPEPGSGGIGGKVTMHAEPGEVAPH